MTDRDTVIKRVFEQPQSYLTTTSYNIKIRIETIAEFVRGLKLERMLDIGCGDGSLSRPLLTGDNRLTLVDRSASMLKIAASRIPPEWSKRVEIINEDFAKATLPEGTFDLIICIGVVAYVEDRRAFVSKIVSLLKPGGTLIMECTDGPHFMTKLSRAYDRVRVRFGGSDFPTLVRPASELVTLLGEFGFRPRAQFRYSLPPQGLRRVLPQPVNYNAVRLIFGKAPRNRAARLGNECIFHFVR